METNKKFKCKDEVIFQNRLHFGDEKLIWNYGIVNYEDEGYVYLVGGLYINKKTFKVLPYEGNEHLVGTSNEPEEEVSLEEGELLVYFEDIKYLENMDLLLARFDGIINDLIKVKTDYMKKWEFAIRFSDFNPNDMEETKKHILCVKNGKVVRYRQK